LGLDELTDRVIRGESSPEELLEWQTTPEGQALLDEPRTAWAFESALERVVREARGPTRRAVCEALLKGGFEHVLPRALAGFDRAKLRSIEPDLRGWILGVERGSDLEDLVQRALVGSGLLVSAAQLRIAVEDDASRLEKLARALGTAPPSKVAAALYRALPSELAFDARMAEGIAAGNFDAVELRRAAESRGLLQERSLGEGLRSAEAGERERALVLALLHGGHRLADAAVEAARGLDAELVTSTAFACRRAPPGRNFVAAAVYFAFVDAEELLRLIRHLADGSFRETNMLALAAAVERCRSPEIDAALRREADAGQDDAMYALAHGRAERFVADLLRWAGTPGRGRLRPTALGLLAESRSDAGVCHLVKVILDAPATAPAASGILRDHGFISAALAEQLSLDSAARVGGRSAALGELSLLGLVQLLVEHGGAEAAPLLELFETHSSPSVAEAAKRARTRKGSPSPYR
jgi:hypothetical protein